MHEQTLFNKSLTILKDIVEHCPNAAVSHAAQELYWSLKAGYKPTQPRHPRGHPDGGQWTRVGGGDTRDHHRRDYRLEVHSNTDITIHKPDGTAERRKDGSRAWRNNNPGNLVYGDFARRHGAIGNNNRFAVFPDEATGAAASEALLRSPGYAKVTINEAIAKRSPSNENNTAQVQRTVRNMGMFSGKEVVGKLNKDEMKRLLDAIKRSEGWMAGSVYLEARK